ncbi:hypothetical protein HDZ31DRAFT_44372 [Schizophyllum fasciatum]
MSFFIRRAWEALIKPARMVGRDLEGNRYYEMPIQGRTTRTSRSVRYKSKEDEYAYISRHKLLPVQWSAWLSHTRQNAPTLEELQADADRQQRLRMKVAMIEARDAEERAHRELLSEPQSYSPSPPTAGEALPAHPIVGAQIAQSAQSTQSIQAELAQTSTEPLNAAPTPGSTTTSAPPSTSASVQSTRQALDPQSARPIAQTPSPFDEHAPKPGSDQPEPWNPGPARRVRRGE